MESNGPVTDIPSPESTVTNLLSSSGYLRSSVIPPDHDTTFRFRNKEYDSASAALDAYIADYDRMQQDSEPMARQLVLPQTPSRIPSRPKGSILRNKDVLRENLTEGELDILNLPISSLRRHGSQDRLSMTTDELLTIPHDGSLPVTHLSALIQGLLSQSGASQSCSSLRRGYRSRDRLSSHAISRLNHHQHHHHPPSRKSGAAVLKPDGSGFTSAHRTARSDWAEMSSSLHLPRWYTDNKEEMDCSGITSVPDLNYPAWVRRCDLSEPPPPSELDLSDSLGDPPPVATRSGAPTWLAELEEDEPSQTPSLADSQQSLKDLRLQFAEHISQLGAERKSSDIMESLHRDTTLEFLIQKADQVLNSLSQCSGGADGLADPACGGAASPVNSEEMQLCFSSHFPPTIDPAMPAGGGMEALVDRGAQAQPGLLPGNGMWRQPGPLEALKQMMFRLQALEAELQRQQQPSAAPAVTNGLQPAESPVKQRPDSEAELESFPAGPSLQRALHHLNRLKLLVEEPHGKHIEDEEEKDLDEGRYSSLSAEGLICTQQTPR